jgi:hypothetical protein
MNLNAILKALVVCALVGGLSACGGSNGDDGSEPLKGRELSDADLCTLRMGQSTEADIIRLFGKPDVSSGGGTDVAVLYYERGTKAASVTTEFTVISGTLEAVDRFGVGTANSNLSTTVPSCLTRSPSDGS